MQDLLCLGTTISTNNEKFFLNEFNSTNNLVVSAIRNEPFMYRDDSGQFHGGIEYKLIKSVAEKEQLTLTFFDRLNITARRQIFISIFDSNGWR